MVSFMLQLINLREKNIRQQLDGASGSVVVEALYYNLEGRGFETRWGAWIFSIYLTLPLAEMSTRSKEIMFLGSKARPLRKSNNLTAICEPPL
jgi:hypothetical protein